MTENIRLAQLLHFYIEQLVHPTQSKANLLRQRKSLKLYVKWLPCEVYRRHAKKKEKQK